MMMREIERLDLKALKNLVVLKEKNQDLLKLEGQRERLRSQIDSVEDQIRSYLQSRPAARTLLNTIRTAASGPAKGRRVNRPRNWLREHVTALLKASRSAKRPAEIRDAIAKKYPEQASKNLYISIFQLLKRGDEFKRNKDGGWSITKSKKKRK